MRQSQTNQLLVFGVLDRDAWAYPLAWMRAANCEASHVQLILDLDVVFHPHKCPDDLSINSLNSNPVRGHAQGSFRFKQPGRGVIVCLGDVLGQSAMPSFVVNQRAQ